jgi:hypothetical protein
MVHVKHNRSSSQIHVVENFISEDECLAMETEAALSLHRATVADGKGGSEYSPTRKAMQAGITVEWDKEEDGDLIARLSRRVYDYAEHVLKMGIEEHGQEDLMSIQYFGRGRNDTEPDRYTPVRVKFVSLFTLFASCLKCGSESMQNVFLPNSHYLVPYYVHSTVTVTAPASHIRPALVWLRW